MQVITEGGGEETIVCVMKTSWLQRGGVFYFTVSHGGVGVWRNTTDRVALPTEIGNDWSSLNDCDVERYQKVALLEAQKFFRDELDIRAGTVSGPPTGKRKSFKCDHERCSCTFSSSYDSTGGGCVVVCN